MATPCRHSPRDLGGRVAHERAMAPDGPCLWSLSAWRPGPRVVIGAQRCAHAAKAASEPARSDTAAAYPRRPSARYTDARPILRALAISEAPRPLALIWRTLAASIEAGRPL
jgi:hypothetical protein